MGLVSQPEELRGLSQLARRLYVHKPRLIHQMTHLRVGICPFDLLIPHVKPDSTVLDAGCGAGLFLALLAGTLSGVRGLGFDSSRSAIEAAARMASHAGKLGLQAELRFVQLDGTREWPPGVYDVVSLIDILHHVPPRHQESFFQNAARSVKPGGTLLYKDIDGGPVLPAIMNRVHDLIAARQWIHYIPHQDVDAWAVKEGLALSHAESIPRLWYRHELRLYRRPRD